MPQVLSGDWSYIAPETASAYVRRIGNMVLMNSKRNSLVGNAGFAIKRAAFENSAIVLTKQVAEMTESVTQWGPEHINKRQAELAKLAVKTWPLELGGQFGGGQGARHHNASSSARSMCC